MPTIPSYYLTIHYWPADGGTVDLTVIADDPNGESVLLNRMVLAPFLTWQDVAQYVRDSLYVITGQDYPGTLSPMVDCT